MTEQTKERLKEYLLDEEKCEAFGNQVAESIFTDDEDPEKAGDSMIRALLDNDANALLIAVCGWSADSILGFIENPE